MAYAEFYNLNGNIAYPFMTTSSGVFNFQGGGTMPNSLVVDCGFTLGPRMDYDHELGATYLYSIERAGDYLYLLFRSVSDSNLSEFLFTRHKDALYGTTDFVEDTGGPLYGVGFLATGDVRSVYDLIGGDGTRLLMEYSSVGHLDSFEATVEPALVVSQRRHAVCSVSVGNMLRITEGPCDGCGYPPEPPDDKTVKLQAGASELVGRVKFRPGYNVAITANKAYESLSIAAVVGEGMGEVCSNDPVRYVGDIPDQGSRCSDFIFTINGVGPNNVGAFQLEGGGGFVVKPVSAGEVLVNSRLGTQVACTSDG